MACGAQAGACGAGVLNCGACQCHYDGGLSVSGQASAAPKPGPRASTAPRLGHELLPPDPLGERRFHEHDPALPRDRRGRRSFGSTRETVTRVLSDFRRESLIEGNGAHVIVLGPRALDAMIST